MKQISVLDTAGKDLGLLEIDFSEKKDSPKTFNHAIRRLLQNWRQGTASCKGRGEVAFANKKPWRQKGTGRARAGSLRSPLWRKGGVTFGPQPRSRRLSINREQKRVAFNCVFSQILQSGASGICCLDVNLQSKKPNTKEAFNILKGIGVENKKVIMFLPFADNKSFLSFRNIPNVSVVCFDQPNVFDLSKSDFWMFFKKDVDLFKEMVSKWN
ncbi:50S ribosomal protein L4 [Candidatus Dependentiae bacterium]